MHEPPPGCGGPERLRPRWDLNARSDAHAGGVALCGGGRREKPSGIRAHFRVRSCRCRWSRTPRWNSTADCLRDGDAVWGIFIALEYYQRQYEAFPDRIAEQSGKLLEDHKAASEKASEAAMAKASQGLLRAVEEVLPKTLSATERRVKWKYIWRSVVFAVVFLVGAATAGMYIVDDRLEHAVSRAFAQAKAVAVLHELGEVNAETLEWIGWLYTPEGRLFQRLKRQGYPVRALLEDAVQCADKQWTLQCVSPVSALTQ